MCRKLVLPATFLSPLSSSTQLWGYDLQALTNPRTFEREFLRYIANQLPATINITLVEILSTHNENEHYLSVSPYSLNSVFTLTALATQCHQARAKLKAIPFL
jgi:hypothetical protein